MRPVWKWAVAGAVAVVVAGGALMVAGAAGATGLPGADLGARAVRRVQVEFGWGEVGRQARFDKLMTQARAEFRPLVNRGKKVQYGQADYPTKALLLKEFRNEVLTAASATAANPPYDEVETPFMLDLLLSIDPAQAKTLLQAGLESGQFGWIPGYMDAVQAAFTLDERKELALHLTGYIRNQILPLIGPALDEPFMEQFILAAPDQGIAYEVLQRPEGLAAALKLYPQLGRQAKLSILMQQQGRSPEEWRPLLAQETDPGVRQWLLLQMNDIEGYLATLENEPAYPYVFLSWERERNVIAEYPDSFLARGVRAYEEVRGLPYFEWDRRQLSTQGWRPTWQYGNRYYNPDGEIPGWLAWLKEYRNHEAADDAAYRLGRSYEIKGQYTEALVWLDEATRLGDGELSSDAASRITWIVDALLSEEQVRALPLDKLPQGVQPLVPYTLAIKEMRAGRYAEAVRDLDAFLTQYGDKLVVKGAWGQSYPFWHNVREQRAQADRLAKLSAAGTAQSRYDEAALIYHDEFIFYNHFWGGGRQGYLYDAMQALEGDMDPAYTAWMAGMNHLIQAAERLDQLKDAPKPIGEKAAYSRAMALIKLMNYGRDVALWKPVNEIRQDGIAALEEFMQRYPKSDLAPDALLSLAYTKRETALFERVAKEYPRSDAAVTARAYKKGEWEPPLTWDQMLPFRYVKPEEAPIEVAERLKALGATGVFQETITVGQFTYILVGRPELDIYVNVGVWDLKDGAIAVRASTWQQKGGSGYAVIRIGATTRPIKFEGLLYR